MVLSILHFASWVRGLVESERSRLQTDEGAFGVKPRGADDRCSLSRDHDELVEGSRSVARSCQTSVAGAGHRQADGTANAQSLSLNDASVTVTPSTAWIRRSSSSRSSGISWIPTLDVS